MVQDADEFLSDAAKVSIRFINLLCMAVPAGKTDTPDMKDDCFWMIQLSQTGMNDPIET